MEQTSGIYIERNSQGIPRFARIDLKKYGDELKDFFSSKGIAIEESLYNPEFIAKIKRSNQQIAEGKFHKLLPKRKLSEHFAGCLSSDRTDELQKELTQMRNEWERDIF
jgi:HAMP domain-containing protein